MLTLNPTITAGWCAQFGAYWGISLLLTWQGPFLIRGLGYSQQAVGWLTALPAGATMIVVFIGGGLSQYLLTRGASSRSARGVFGGAAVGVGGITLLIMPLLPSRDLKLAATTISIALSSLIFIIVPAVVGEIVPVRQRGALLAIGNAIATMAGLLGPYVMGSVIENAANPTEGFDRGFVVCGVVMLIGGVFGTALIRPQREVSRWATNIGATTHTARWQP